MDTKSKRVRVKLWDVRWVDGGLGKHGHGPFATREQAERCLRAVGLAGTVELGLWEMDESQAARIAARAPKRR